MPEGGWVTATWARQCPADALRVARVGVEPTDKSPRFELGRFTGLRTVPFPQASPAGFEPAISTLTGWRALQAAPRGQIILSSSGGTRTHSIPGSKPRWSADCLPSHIADPSQCPRQESNLQTFGFKPNRSAVGVLGPSSPGWTRTTGACCGPGVFAVRRRDRVCKWTHGIRTQIFGLRSRRPPVGR